MEAALSWCPATSFPSLLTCSLPFYNNVPFMGVPKLHEHTLYHLGLPARRARAGGRALGRTAPISL